MSRSPLSGTVAASRLRLIVVASDLIAEGVLRLTLADASGRRLPAWMPGAHIDLTGPTRITRPYSLCGDVRDSGSWQVAVLHEPQGDGGSSALHEHAVVGMELSCEGLRNHFRLVDSPSYLFIAGGIGITPIMSMIRLLEGQDPFAPARSWKLLYAGRRLATMAFRDELQAYADKVMQFPSDSGGHIDVAAEISATAPNTVIFCCGPAALTEVVESASAAAGRDCYFERFVPPGSPQEMARGADFTVELKRSGKVIHVPDGQTILEAAEAADVHVRCSCRQGICGSCETRVLDGIPDHRDGVLDHHEREVGKTMMICVSRAQTPLLVLDA